MVWQGKCISLETPSPRMAVGQVFTLGYGIHMLSGGTLAEFQAVTVEGM